MITGDILFFGITERPYFIALNLCAGEIMKYLILIFSTGLTNFSKQLNNRVLCCASHPDSSSNAVTFY
jgi:hypothetical protein